MPRPIIIDESLFEESFVPEKILCRQEQIRDLIRCLQRVKCGKSTKNQHIHGPPGVGKTSTVKWILKEEFEKNSAYVNCWSKRTQHKILESILSQMRCFVHGAEPTSKLLERFKEKARKEFVICLDECDQIQETEILYDLGRSPCTLVLISNEKNAFVNTDTRIKRSLYLERREFKPYTSEEILSILKDRVSRGFREDSVSNGLLSKISKMCDGDIRVALQTLKIAAINTELKGSDKITIHEVKEAIECTRKHRLSYLLSKLNNFQKTIFEILNENKKMCSKDLYEKCRKTSSQSFPGRTYRHYMRSMVDLGLVRSGGTKRWKTYEIA